MNREIVCVRNLKAWGATISGNNLKTALKSISLRCPEESVLIHTQQQKKLKQPPLWVYKRSVPLLDLHLWVCFLIKKSSSTTFTCTSIILVPFKLSLRLISVKLYIYHIFDMAEMRNTNPISIIMLSPSNITCPRRCARGRGQGNWTVEHPMGCIWYCQEQFAAGAGCARSVSAWFRLALLVYWHQGESLLNWPWLELAGECTGITITPR